MAMSKGCLAVVCVVAIGGLALGQGPAGTDDYLQVDLRQAQRAPSAQQPQAAATRSLALSVSSRRTNILTCEPLVFDISIRNRGSAPAQVYVPVRYNGPLVVEVTGPDGQTNRYYPLSRPIGLVRTRVLGPGEVYRQREVLQYGILDVRGKGKQEGFIFPSPGTYRFNMWHGGGDPGSPRLDAEPLEVTIQEPRGRDPEALEVLRQESGRRFMGHVYAPLEALERVAKDYGDTVYGRYAQYFLATRRGGPTYLLKKGGGEHLEALLKDAPDFPVADECLLHVAKYYLVMGRNAEAKAALQEIVTKYPDSPVIEEASRRLGLGQGQAEGPSSRPAP